MKNREVAGVLRELADTMELLGKDRYRVANYRDAATRVEHHHEPIEIMADQQRVEQLHGVGKSIGAKIVEYLSTGKLGALEERRPRVPAVSGSAATNGIGRDSRSVPRARPLAALAPGRGLTNVPQRRPSRACAAYPRVPRGSPEATPAGAVPTVARDIPRRGPIGESFGA
jgi:hypothetical protein